MSSLVLVRAIVQTEKESLALYSLSDPDAEVAKRAEVLEVRRREAIARLADRWVGKPSNPREP